MVLDFKMIFNPIKIMIDLMYMVQKFPLNKYKELFLQQMIQDLKFHSFLFIDLNFIVKIY